MKPPINISLADRLRYGALGLQEFAVLKGLSVAKVRGEAERELLPTFRHGRCRLVQGPIAERYLREGAP